MFDHFVCWMDIKLPIHWYRIHSQNRVPSQGHELLRFFKQNQHLAKGLKCSLGVGDAHVLVVDRT